MASSNVREDSNACCLVHSEESSSNEWTISKRDLESLSLEIMHPTQSPLFIITEWKKKNVNSSSDSAVQFLELVGNNLSEDSKRLLCVPNAGGNSVFSEVLSFEFIQKLFEKFNTKVSLHKTEMELEYAEGSKITDFSFKVDNETTMGCSVTRSFNYFDLNSVPSDASIKQLLKKKLSGVIDSTRGVLNDKWERQVLHIWTTNQESAEAIKRVYENEISDELKSNTIVIVTVALSGFECIYRERGDDALNAMKMLGLTPLELSEDQSDASLDEFVSLDF